MGPGKESHMYKPKNGAVCIVILECGRAQLQLSGK